jgi:hypothetical protein
MRITLVAGSRARSRLMELLLSLLIITLIVLTAASGQRTRVLTSECNKVLPAPIPLGVCLHNVELMDPKMGLLHGPRTS